MIIKHADDNETNTDKLPDVDAMVLEKCEELRDLCFKTSRQFALTVNGRNNNYYFWNLRTNKNIEESKNITSEEFNKMLNMLNSLTDIISDKQVSLYPNEIISNYIDKINQLTEELAKYKSEE